MTNKHNSHHGHHHHNHCPVPCFVEGSNILTKTGSIEVQNLKPGMMILTRDNGYKEISWVGSALSDSYYELDKAKFSPNHRVLNFIQNEEVFTPVKFHKSSILVSKQTTVVHFTLDIHEIVLSDNVWSETFYPGSYIMTNMDKDASDEIIKLFPEWNKWKLARKEIKHENCI